MNKDKEKIYIVTSISKYETNKPDFEIRHMKPAIFIKARNDNGAIAAYMHENVLEQDIESEKYVLICLSDMCDFDGKYQKMFSANKKTVISYVELTEKG